MSLLLATELMAVVFEVPTFCVDSGLQASATLPACHDTLMKLVLYYQDMLTQVADIFESLLVHHPLQRRLDFIIS